MQRTTKFDPGDIVRCNTGAYELVVGELYRVVDVHATFLKLQSLSQENGCTVYGWGDWRFSLSALSVASTDGDTCDVQKG